MYATILTQARRDSFEGISVYDHVSAQQQVVNISIDRSIELYLAKHALPEEAFTRLKRAYEHMRERAAALGVHQPKCGTCPDVPDA